MVDQRRSEPRLFSSNKATDVREGDTLNPGTTIGMNLLENQNKRKYNNDVFSCAILQFSRRNYMFCFIRVTTDLYSSGPRKRRKRSFTKALSLADS